MRRGREKSAVSVWNALIYQRPIRVMFMVILMIQCAVVFVYFPIVFNNSPILTSPYSNIDFVNDTKTKKEIEHFELSSNPLIINSNSRIESSSLSSSIADALHHEINIENERIRVLTYEETENENGEEMNSGYGNCSAIFSINSGRSGSAYLAKMLSYAENVHVEHENYAERWSNEYHHEVKQRGYQHSYQIRKQLKAAEIEAIFKQNKIYAETSQLFIKSFYDVATDYLIERGCDLKVIVLRRYVPEIVLSLHQLDFPSMSEYGWYYTPDHANAITTPIWYIDPITSYADVYERIIAYLIDLEAKVEDYHLRYPNIPIINVELNELQSEEGVMSLFDSLNLQLNATKERSFTSQVGTTVNRRLRAKNAKNLEEDVTMIMNIIDTYYQRASLFNVTLPLLPISSPIHPPDDLSFDFS
jgi:hypothetical protein